MTNSKNPLSIIYLIFLPLHLGVLIMPFITSFTWLHIFYFLMGYILISGLGNNVGLHRWAGHRAIELGKYSKNIVLYFSLMACQGHPIWWAAVHRGQHHKFSDTDKDSHSPINGKWHAFFGWELKHDPSTVNYKYAVDLMRDPILIKTSKYYEAIIITSWIIVGLFSVDLLLWMFILPTVLALHLEGMVNLFCHTNYGYRNFDTTDNSRNIFLLGLFDWGNGWHNNHHAKASAYDFGSSVSGKWWEFDACRIFKPFLKL